MKIASYFNVDYHGGFQTPKSIMYNAMLFKHELAIIMVVLSWNSHHTSLVHTHTLLLNLSSTSCRSHLHT
jgi:hypothetical protein